MFRYFACRRLGDMSIITNPKTPTSNQPPQLEWLWTCAGTCFGYRKGRSLFTHHGVEVGRFLTKDVYGPEGRYLGEIRRTEDGDRLMVSRYKSARSASEFTPGSEQPGDRPTNRKPQSLYCGYDDFPSPDALREQVLKRARDGRPAPLPLINPRSAAEQGVGSNVVINSGLVEKLTAQSPYPLKVKGAGADSIGEK